MHAQGKKTLAYLTTASVHLQEQPNTCLYTWFNRKHYWIYNFERRKTKKEPTMQHSSLAIGRWSMSWRITHLFHSSL